MREKPIKQQKVQQPYQTPLQHNIIVNYFQPKKEKPRHIKIANNI